MISKLDNKNRNVVPNWRDFERTVSLGELTIPSKGIIVGKAKTPINYTVLERDWRKNRSLHHATDLFSALVTNNVLNTGLVSEVTEYILNHSNASFFQKDFVNKILNNTREDERNVILEYGELIEYANLLQGEEIYRKIRFLKDSIAKYPRNSILYVELARYYTLISQFNKAEYYISLALKLDPLNRYVVRSAARFYILINEIEKARYSLRRSRLLQHDPWLLASEISISEIMGKTSNYIKKGFELSESKKFREFDLTELRSSLASVELFKGKIKTSKKLFRKSLVEPNDNSMAQVEWASNKFNLFLVDLESYNVNNNFEAIFYDAAEQHDWTKAFRNALMWYLDTPYAIEPVVAGAYIAGLYLNDYEKAEGLIKSGLFNNPNDSLLINNLAYYLAKNSKIEEARTTLNRVDSLNQSEIKPTTLVCLDATKGLIEIKNGNLDLGVDFYERAISKAKLIIGDTRFVVLAELELALALPIGNEKRNFILEKYDKFPEGLGANDLDRILLKIRNKQN